MVSQLCPIGFQGNSCVEIIFMTIVTFTLFPWPYYPHSFQSNSYDQISFRPADLCPYCLQVNRVISEFQGNSYAD